MTKAQEKLCLEFDSFLNKVDFDFKDYFSSDKALVNSVLRCFVIVNGNKLRYSKSTCLRSDIMTLIINKHKELWLELHDFKPID